MLNKWLTPFKGLCFYWGSSKDQTSRTGSSAGPCGLSMSSQLDDHLRMTTIGTQSWGHSNKPSRTLVPEKGLRINSINLHSLLMRLISSLPNSNHWPMKQPIAWMISQPYPCSHPSFYTKWWTISTGGQTRDLCSMGRSSTTLSHGQHHCQQPPGSLWRYPKEEFPTEERIFGLTNSQDPWSQIAIRPRHHGHQSW